MKDRIRVRNARQHNLKGIDIDIPRRSVVVVTGPSGSGKSSLAFDTIYAEGQRRYVESLSTYAKQFLERMRKPAVDAIEGVSPAVAIERKNPTKTSRSTVGTATEVHDYLRLLWARAGRTYCPECGHEVRPDSARSAADRVLALDEDVRFLVAFPLPRSARVRHDSVIENLRVLGFLRVLVGDEQLRIDEADAETPEGFGHDLAGAEDVLVVVDRLKVGDGVRERLVDALETAFDEGEGEAAVVVVPHGGTANVRAGGAADAARYRRMRFTERFRCPEHPAVDFLEPQPRLFSFNSPYGSCPECTGFGATLEYDTELIIPNPDRTLADGAVDPWQKPRYKRERQRLREFADDEGVALDRSWADLPVPFRNAVVHGERGEDGRRVKGGFKGVIPFLRSRERKRYKAYIRVFLRQYQTARECRSCGGGRLRPEALRVYVGGLRISEAEAMTVGDLRAWFRDLGAARDDEGTPVSADQKALQEVPFRPAERAIAAPVLREIDARLGFLDDVGLGYLTLDRQARTLAGGEAQRIALANSLGAKLVDTLYVLDEPTIGLHPRDTDRLLALLEGLRDAGNTVLVVEHDPAVIGRADHVIELGPASGEAGGDLVFEGGFDGLVEADTVTGRYSSGREPVPEPDARRPVNGPRLRLEGARLNNLRGIDVDVPLRTLTVVTGVSGSGKSTLVHDVLFRALERELEDGETSAKRYLGEMVGDYESLEGAGSLGGVVMVDQSPIGGTPRSNPVTYIKAFKYIRSIFADQPLARERDYSPGHFSFNVKGGRCESCKGDGTVKVEMVFMADAYVPCDVCGGARYRPEILEVRCRGLSIRDVLDLTVDEAIRFFLREDRLGRRLWQLQQVGLGYLRLGQAAPTLSGGEAQRLKIARELVRGGRKDGRRLYILDEPTTGLAGADVKNLLRVFNRLINAGNTVLVIEHNLDVIRAADWVIDLGPEAGAAGGRVIAVGRPEQVAAVHASHTGRYLREVLDVPEPVPARN